MSHEMPKNARFTASPHSKWRRKVRYRTLFPLSSNLPFLGLIAASLVLPLVRVALYSLRELRAASRRGQKAVRSHLR